MYHALNRVRSFGKLIGIAYKQRSRPFAESSSTAASSSNAQTTSALSVPDFQPHSRAHHRETSIRIKLDKDDTLSSDFPIHLQSHPRTLEAHHNMHLFHAAFSLRQLIQTHNTQTQHLAQRRPNRLISRDRANARRLQRVPGFGPPTRSSTASSRTRIRCKTPHCIVNSLR